MGNQVVTVETIKWNATAHFKDENGKKITQKFKPMFIVPKTQEREEIIKTLQAVNQPVEEGQEEREEFDVSVHVKQIEGFDDEGGEPMVIDGRGVNDLLDNSYYHEAVVSAFLDFLVKFSSKN